MLLWKVVGFGDIVTLVDGSIVIIESSLMLGFGTLIDGSLVITEASSLLRFCYSNEW